MRKQPAKRYHLILDAVGVENKYLTDKEFLKKFLKEIVKLVNMNILYGPIAVEGVPENPGLSTFCIIDFSHISIHTFTETKEIYVDVFSCMPFDYSKIEKYLIKKFNLQPEQIFKAKPKYN